MSLEFKRLSEVDCSEYVALNTHPLVMRQMPLSDSDFDEAVCREWVKDKERMWEEHGYGPWEGGNPGRTIYPLQVTRLNRRQMIHLL